MCVSVCLPVCVAEVTPPDAREDSEARSKEVMFSVRKYAGDV